MFFIRLTALLTQVVVVLLAATFSALIKLPLRMRPARRYEREISTMNRAQDLPTIKAGTGRRGP